LSGDDDLPDTKPLKGTTSIPLSFPPGEGKDYNYIITQDLQKLKLHPDMPELRILCPFGG